MILAIGSDHAGYALKEYAKPLLQEWGHVIQDVGSHSEKPVDYPVIAEQVALLIKEEKADIGILFCGTGQGMAIVANKIPGIRAAVCDEAYSARVAREHNNANILALGSRVVGLGVAELILKVFLDSQFAGGRHQKRTDLIVEIENKYLKQGDV
jgi:ribose 5-phosphate isomerase B